MYPNPKSRVFQPRLAARSRQEGAALYVALMILVLLLRPQGLFGWRQIERL